MGVCQIVLLAIVTVEGLGQVTILTQPQDATVVEGGNATFQCAGEENGTAVQFIWDFAPVGGPRGAVITGSQLAGVSSVTVNSDRTQLTLRGLQREVDGATVLCSAVGSTGNVDSDPASVIIQYPPTYSLLPIQTATTVEGVNFTYSFEFGANPIPTNFTWSRGGQVISSGGRIATSVSTINIIGTTRSDSGVYTVVSYNELGSGEARFALDVQYPPQIINRASQTLLGQGEVFTFNCTSEPANPPAVNYFFQMDGQAVDSARAAVQGPVLAISSVQAGDGGNYSCSAKNSVGRDTIYNNLIAPPSAPRAITVSDKGPFLAAVSWQLPLEDGGTVGPLMYTVRLMNTSTTITFNPTADLTMSLANLRHSVTYRVQVVAGNEAGVGPAAEVLFRTDNTVPTVGGVEARTLTLDTVQVNVTVSDDGGQPVLEYIVIVDSREVQTSALPAHITGLNLAVGVTYGIGAVARNSIGESKTFVGTFSVPAASSSAPSYGDLQAMAIAFGIALFILLLLLVVAIVTAAMLYASKRKLSPSVEHIGASSVQYDDVEPRARPQLNLAQPPTLPPFEERREGGTGNNVTLEKNPAYQSLDAHTTPQTDESLYL